MREPPDRAAQSEEGKMSIVQACGSVTLLWQEEAAPMPLSWGCQFTELRSEIITAGHKRWRENKDYCHKEINCFGELVKESGEFGTFLSFRLKSFVT